MKMLVVDTEREEALNLVSLSVCLSVPVIKYPSTTGFPNVKAVQLIKCRVNWLLIVFCYCCCFSLSLSPSRSSLFSLPLAILICTWNVNVPVCSLLCGDGGSLSQKLTYIHSSPFPPCPFPGPPPTPVSTPTSAYLLWQQIEFEWVLRQEVHAILKQLRSILIVSRTQTRIH